MTKAFSEKASIYCDESGNTGSNLMPKTDLFFVYAWVLLKKDQEDLLIHQLHHLFSEEGLPVSYELSSVKLWQSARGRARWVRVLELAYEAGAYIYLSIVEKRFELCVRVASTYLDSDHNPSVDASLLTVEFRRSFHNAIYTSISTSLLTRFLQASHSDDVPELKRIGLIIGRQLSLHPDARVANAASVMLAGIDDIYRFGKHLDGAPKNIHLSNSQATAFLPSLIYLDMALNTHSLKAHLIRDQDMQFGEILDYAFELLSRPPSPMRNFLSCSEEMSSHAIGIQIADLAAGIATRVFSAKFSGRTLKAEGWSIWKSLRASLTRGNWSYQLTSELAESKLNPLWDDKFGPSFLEKPSIIDKDNPLRCNCGTLITSGKISDFYLHVIEQHPSGEIIGLACPICGELVPLFLGSCHEIIDHSIDPPFRGDFYFEMRKNHAVLQLVKASGVKITALAPKT